MNVELEVDESDPQWMAWLADRVCPLCGREIKEVVPNHRGCAVAYPCSHRVLRGADAVPRIRSLWSR